MCEVNHDLLAALNGDIPVLEVDVSVLAKVEERGLEPTLNASECYVLGLQVGGIQLNTITHHIQPIEGEFIRNHQDVANGSTRYIHLIQLGCLRNQHLNHAALGAEDVVEFVFVGVVAEVLLELGCPSFGVPVEPTRDPVEDF